MVGRSALSYFARETGDSRLKAGLEKAFLNQTGGIYEGVRLGSATFSLAVAPHPSGKSRFWNRPPREADQAFKRIIQDIERILKT